MRFTLNSDPATSPVKRRRGGLLTLMSLAALLITSVPLLALNLHVSLDTYAEGDAEILSSDFLTSYAVTTNSVTISGVTNGAVFYITATPEGNKVFQQWSVIGPLVVTDPFSYDTTVTVNGNGRLTAHFSDVQYRLRMYSDGHHASMSPAVGSTNYYAAGMNAPISTAPQANWAFKWWGTPGSDSPYAAVANPTSASTTVRMDMNHDVQAYFSPIWSLQITDSQGPGSATLTQKLADGTLNTVLVNSIVNNSATHRYRAIGWNNGYGDIPASGSALSYGPYTVSQNSGIRWAWTNQYRLRITTSVGGTTSPEPGTNHWYDQGAEVVLTAGTDPGYIFTGWTGDINALGSITLTMNRKYDVHANFALVGADSDGDGLPDEWEARFGLDPNDPNGLHGATGDPDRDGLENLQELRIADTNRMFFCSPINADSDGDGMDDRYEWLRLQTNFVSNDGSKVPAPLDDGEFDVNNGPLGNPDGDFVWSTDTGYRLPESGLNNLMEWTGPDGIGPYTYKNVSPGDPDYPPFPAGQTRPAVVRIAVPDSNDTGDQSSSKTTDTDKDGFDDGYEYSWDRWQQVFGGTNEVFYVGPSLTGMAVYVTNVVPEWTGTNADRRYNPAVTHVDTAGEDPEPDFDVLYDFETGGVSRNWYSDLLEYGASATNAFSMLIPEAPHSIRRDVHPTWERCSHPFFIDVDQDGLPDGWEVIFGYDPWAAVTPGDDEVDTDRNPDDDWMAMDGTNRHNQVYQLWDFDPRTAFRDVYPGPGDVPNGPGVNGAPNTAAYSNLEEVRGADALIRLTPLASIEDRDDATNPWNIDTDGDRIWDGWELYVGLNPQNTFDGDLDADGDGVANIDEFLSYVTSTDNRLALTPLPEWLNKIFPTDPFEGDTDGDFVPDGAERDNFNGQGISGVTNLVFNEDNELVMLVFESGAYTGSSFVDGGLNPTSADTDGDSLPDPYELSMSTALNGTIGDDAADPDGDLLPNWMEYWTCATYHWQYDWWHSHSHIPPYDSADFFTGVPYEWDWHVMCRDLPYYYIPPPYSGTYPGQLDSDNDGFDDYYEIFHGQNPLYGVYDLVATRVFEMLVYVNDLWPFWPHPFTYDATIWPYVVGTAFTDPDGDGLSDDDESIGSYPFDAPTLHTDPTPIWMTDTSYPNSLVNLYYDMNLGSYEPDVWYPWVFVGYPPYTYDFEINEGYDTDNDFMADYDEVVGDYVDGQDAERPVRRRALYLPEDHDAYARTVTSYYYGGEALRSFTVEAWIRPTTPVRGHRQVIIERSLFVPEGNQMVTEADYEYGKRANFVLFVDESGRPGVSYDGNGKQIIFVEAKGSSETRVPADRWTHLAGTYEIGDPSGLPPGKLTLYVNGQVAAQQVSDHIPAQGRFGSGSIVWIAYSTMTIGAADESPYGEVAPLPTAQPQPTDWFKGWIDSVRVWDNARSQSDILTTMKVRLRYEDVLASYGTAHPLYAVYHFDDMPDPIHNGIVPEGFNDTMSVHAPDDWFSINAWALSPEQSMVYDDYRIYPWIENSVAHTPTWPPRDLGDTNAVVQTNMFGEIIYQYPNSSNPYNYTYGIIRGSALGPDMLPLRWAEADEDVPMWDDGGIPAAEPYDSDGDGMDDEWEERNGLDPLDPSGENGADGDPDGDGLTNWYEYLTGNDPRSGDSDGDGVSDANEDFDMDGLVNSDELAIGTMPHMKDTDDDGVSDWEEVTASTDPIFDATRPLTSQAPDRPTDPTDSLDPAVQRSMYFDGSARLIIPPQNELMSTDWTLEMWVHPTESRDSVTISRHVLGTEPGEYGINYELGLTTAAAPAGGLRPYVRYRNKDGQEIRLDGTGSTDNSAGLAPLEVPLNEWTHLAATYHSVSNELTLYVNADLAAYRTDATPLPATVYGYTTDHWGDEVTVGAARSTGALIAPFKGYIDEVRFWRGVRTGAEIKDRYNGPEARPGSLIGTAITLRRRTIMPDPGVESSIATLPPDKAARMLVQFEGGEPTASQISAMQSAGINVLNYVSPGTRAVTATPRQLEAIAGNVRWAGMLRPADKIASLLNVDGSHAARPILVQFFNDVPAAEAVASAQAAGAAVSGAGYIGGSYLVVEATDTQIASLAADNSVAWIAKAAEGLAQNAAARVCPHGLAVGGLQVAPFALVGDGWDGPGLGPADLLYHFINDTADMPPEDSRGAIVNQLNKWASVAALSFTETTLPGRDFSIDFLFAAGEHGDGFPFDGPFGVLAHAFYPNDINPEPIAGDTHFDEDENWTIGNAGIDLRWVALHELGHALGLGHSADPDAIMYPFYTGGTTPGIEPQLGQDDIDGILSLYGSRDTGLEFRFDDGGLTAEDFSVSKDWENNWASAGILDGCVFSSDTVPNLDKDTDGDGMPDWWELAHGLSATDGNGANGRYGDPDGDELINIYEFFARTDPRLQDSDRDGYNDYFSWRAPIYRTFGEIYSDMDHMPDDWEAVNDLDPGLYDAQLDPDRDGWSNQGEYLGGTDPQVSTNYPIPELTFDVRYDGLKSGGDLVVLAYHDAEMGGRPTAVYSTAVLPTIGVFGEQLGFSGALAYSGSLDYQNIVPGTLTISEGGDVSFFDDGNGGLVGTQAGNVGTIDYATGGYTFTYAEPMAAGNPITADYSYRQQTVEYPGEVVFSDTLSGHLREGRAWFFGFIDLDGDLTWTPGEPAGMLDRISVQIGAGNVSGIVLNLSDQTQVPWYHRFSWAAQPDVERYLVKLYANNGGSTMIIKRWITAGRTFFHEQDYRAMGDPSVNAWYYGLQGGMSYSWQVMADDVVGATIFESGSFTVPSITVQTPTPIWPISESRVIHANSEFEWHAGATAAATRMRIGRVSSTDWITTSEFVSPWRSGEGNYRKQLGLVFGDNTWRNDTYRWQISTRSTGQNWTPWSAEGRFEIDIQPPPQGAPALSGEVLYFGKASGPYDLKRIMVQACESSAFSGIPSAHIMFTYKCDLANPTFRKGDFELNGLYPKRYYVRAFVDMNVNGQCDDWEPQGFVETDEWRPLVQDLGGISTSRRNLEVIIRDRDTDNDKLPDGWEYFFFNTLEHGASYDPDNDGLTALQEYTNDMFDSDPTLADTDGDGLDDGYEHELGLDPNSSDTDGDGLSDSYELANGFNALAADMDGDGLSDGEEVALGTNPFAADSDGDTSPDGEEVIARTNPLDGNDVLRILAIDPLVASATSGITLAWPARSGVTYRVQRSLDMRNWNVMDIRNVQSDGTQSVTDAVSAEDGAIYYRVGVDRQ